MALDDGMDAMISPPSGEGGTSSLATAVNKILGLSDDAARILMTKQNSNKKDQSQPKQPSQNEKVAMSILRGRCLTKEAKLKDEDELYPHQQRIIRKSRNQKNLIIAHPVGSGKTLSMIGSFEDYRNSHKGAKALVVTPASLRENFADSVKHFTDSNVNIIGNKQERSGKGGEYGELDPNKDYNVVSYELFRRDPQGILNALHPSTAIFDELHRGKNVTKTYKSIRDTRNMYDRFIGGTGSVISNKPADMLSLIDAAEGGENQLTKQDNVTHFDKEFFKRDNSKRSQQVAYARRPIVGVKNEKRLGNYLDKYIDYMDFDEIKDVAKMPGRDFKEIRVPLSFEQEHAYKKLLKEDPALRKTIAQKRFEYLKDDELSKVYNQLTEARKLVNDVGTIHPGMSEAESVEQTPKTKAMLDDMAHFLEKNPSNKAIATSFLIKGGTDTIEQGLRNRGIHYGKFLGKGNEGVTEESRQYDVKKYNADRLRTMVLSGAGGEGLSLNNTNEVFMLDQHFNPERNSQMAARGIRSGSLAKLPKDERIVHVREYVSTMPEHKFLGLIPYKSSLQTPDEIIESIAQRKEKQNNLVHNVLKRYRSDD